MRDTGGVDIERHVSAEMTAQVTPGTDVALLIAVAPGTPCRREELEVQLNGVAVDVHEASDPLGNRLHVIRGLAGGLLSIRYAAGGVGTGPLPSVDDVDDVVHRRPSRYCEVDEFGAPAAEIVGELSGDAAVRAVVDWVASHLDYVPGSSTVLDSARTTYLSRQGVCRDYAHVTTTLLRAAGIPARCTSVYAPGLSPMDFHLVVEALVDGQWQVVDATHLAPRASMVRIASGADASETAFMTTLEGDVQLQTMRVMATVDPELPVDVPHERVILR